MILLILQTVELEALIKRFRSSTKVVTNIFFIMYVFSDALTLVIHNIGGENWLHYENPRITEASSYG